MLLPSHLSEPTRLDSRTRVGILGGTFDPIHRGHLAIAIAAVQQAKLNQLLWIPDPHPPHKAVPDVTPLSHRINMIECAIAAWPNHHVWQVSDDGSAPSFAIATLSTLQQHKPGCCWFWILGLDAFCSLPKWYHSQELVEQCQWIVAPRLTFEQSQFAPELIGQPPSMQAIDFAQSKERCDAVVAQFAKCDRTLCYQLLTLDSFHPIPASSSLIRQYFYQHSQRGGSPDPPDGQSDFIHQWLPSAVQHYIQQHQLYSNE